MRPGMAQEPTVEDPIVAFKKANMNAIRRVMDRAQEKSEQLSRRPGAKAAFRRGALTRALDHALADHGRTAKTRPSIRITAPDTGGRPYHFGLTTVTKGKRAPRGSRNTATGPAGPAAAPSRSVAAANTGTAGASAGKPAATAAMGGARGLGRAAKTREGAHQAYTERDGAVERDMQPVDPDLLQRANNLDGQGQETEPELAIKEERERGLNIQEDAAEERTREPPSQTPAEAGMDIDEMLGAAKAARREAAADPADNVMSARERHEDAMAWVEDRHSEPGLSGDRSEAAAQAYVEDPAKVARIRGTTSSFGTIGDTLEERMAFWDLVHEHESSAGGRTQSRLVLELPHEASAKARHQIVRRYVQEFEDKGIPYWATIHEPTRHNDSRNYHAHVVFTDRPMSKMRHPETGQEVWDFTVEEVHIKKNRVRQVRHPYRQNRDPEMRDRGWVRESRKRFAAIVNDVMVEHGVGVRYDPRSYKDMGLDVKPMESVSRILADQAKKRRFVALDPEWTRRLIDAEMRETALRRDAAYQKLQAAEQRLQEAARQSAIPDRANRHLPPGMRLSPGHTLGSRIAQNLAERMARAERDRLAVQYVDEATEKTIARIIEATGNDRAWKGRGAAAAEAAGVDPNALRTLHEAAQEEMRNFTEEKAGRARASAIVAATLKGVWTSGADPRRPIDVQGRQPDPGTERPVTQAGYPSVRSPAEDETVSRDRGRPAFRAPGPWDQPESGPTATVLSTDGQEGRGPAPLAAQASLAGTGQEKRAPVQSMPLAPQASDPGPSAEARRMAADHAAAMAQMSAAFAGVAPEDLASVMAMTAQRMAAATRAAMRAADVMESRAKQTQTQPDRAVDRPPPTAAAPRPPQTPSRPATTENSTVEPRQPPMPGAATRPGPVARRETKQTEGREQTASTARRDPRVMPMRQTTPGTATNRARQPSLFEPAPVPTRRAAPDAAEAKPNPDTANQALIGQPTQRTAGRPATSARHKGGYDEERRPAIGPQPSAPAAQAGVTGTPSTPEAKQKGAAPPEDDGTAAAEAKRKRRKAILARRRSLGVER